MKASALFALAWFFPLVDAANAGESELLRAGAHRDFSMAAAKETVSFGSRRSLSTPFAVKTFGFPVSDPVAEGLDPAILQRLLNNARIWRADGIVILKNGKLVGTTKVSDVTEDDVLGMIILGKTPTPKPNGGAQAV